MTLSGAQSWLEKHLSERSSYLVLHRILRRKDIPDEDWLVVAKLALDCLAAPPKSPTERANVVNSLLRRPAILPYAMLQAAVEAKLENWLSVCAMGKKGDDVDVLNAVAHLPVGDPLARKVRATLG